MKPIDLTDSTYTLAAELAFLDGLGTYSDAGRLYDRGDLLAGYPVGLAKRERGFNEAQKRVIRERVAIIRKTAENEL